jgi:hypothetical protein
VRSFPFPLQLTWQLTLTTFMASCAVSVLVKFESGATMTYHLTSYSPWEGMRVMFNGCVLPSPSPPIISSDLSSPATSTRTKGRLELEVVETRFRTPQLKGQTPEGVIHGETALPNEGQSKITLHPLWEEPKEVPFVLGRGGHGGGDERMLNQIFVSLLLPFPPLPTATNS